MVKGSRGLKYFIYRLSKADSVVKRDEIVSRKLKRLQYYFDHPEVTQPHHVRHALLKVCYVKILGYSVPSSAIIETAVRLMLHPAKKYKTTGYLAAALLSEDAEAVSLKRLATHGLFHELQSHYVESRGLALSWLANNGDSIMIEPVLPIITKILYNEAEELTNRVRAAGVLCKYVNIAGTSLFTIDDDAVLEISEFPRDSSVSAPPRLSRGVENVDVLVPRYSAPDWMISLPQLMTELLPRRLALSLLHAITTLVLSALRVAPLCIPVEPLASAATQILERLISADTQDVYKRSIPNDQRHVSAADWSETEYGAATSLGVENVQTLIFEGGQHVGGAFVYHQFPAPWLHCSVLRLLRLLGPSLDAHAVGKLTPLVSPLLRGEGAGTAADATTLRDLQQRQYHTIPKPADVGTVAPSAPTSSAGGWASRSAQAFPADHHFYTVRLAVFTEAAGLVLSVPGVLPPQNLAQVLRRLSTVGTRCGDGPASRFTRLSAGNARLPPLSGRLVGVTVADWIAVSLGFEDEVPFSAALHSARARSPSERSRAITLGLSFLKECTELPDAEKDHVVAVLLPALSQSLRAEAPPLSPSQQADARIKRIFANRLAHQILHCSHSAAAWTAGITVFLGNPAFYTAVEGGEKAITGKFTYTPVCSGGEAWRLVAQILSASGDGVTKLGVIQSLMVTLRLVSATGDVLPKSIQRPTPLLNLCVWAISKYCRLVPIAPSNTSNLEVLDEDRPITVYCSVERRVELFKCAYEAGLLEEILIDRECDASHARDLRMQAVVAMGTLATIRHFRGVPVPPEDTGTIAEDLSASLCELRGIRDWLLSVACDTDVEVAQTAALRGTLIALAIGDCEKVDCDESIKAIEGPKSVFRDATLLRRFTAPAARTRGVAPPPRAAPVSSEHENDILALLASHPRPVFTPQPKVRANSAKMDALPALVYTNAPRALPEPSPHPMLLPLEEPVQNFFEIASPTTARKNLEAIEAAEAAVSVVTEADNKADDTLDLLLHFNEPQKSLHKFASASSLPALKLSERLTSCFLSSLALDPSFFEAKAEFSYSSLFVDEQPVLPASQPLEGAMVPAATSFAYSPVVLSDNVGFSVKVVVTPRHTLSSPALWVFDVEITVKNETASVTAPLAELPAVAHGQVAAAVGAVLYPVQVTPQRISAVIPRNESRLVLRRACLTSLQPFSSTSSEFTLGLPVSQKALETQVYACVVVGDERVSVPVLPSVLLHVAPVPRTSLTVNSEKSFNSLWGACKHESRGVIVLSDAYKLAASEFTPTEALHRAMLKCRLSPVDVSGGGALALGLIPITDETLPENGAVAAVDRGDELALSALAAPQESTLFALRFVIHSSIGHALVTVRSTSSLAAHVITDAIGSAFGTISSKGDDSKEIEKLGLGHEFSALFEVGMPVRVPPRPDTPESETKSEEPEAVVESESAKVESESAKVEEKVVAESSSDDAEKSDEQFEDPAESSETEKKTTVPSLTIESPSPRQDYVVKQQSPITEVEPTSECSSECDDSIEKEAPSSSEDDVEGLHALVGELITSPTLLSESKVTMPDWWYQ